MTDVAKFIDFSDFDSLKNYVKNNNITSYNVIGLTQNKIDFNVENCLSKLLYGSEKYRLKYWVSG